MKIISKYENHDGELRILVLKAGKKEYLIDPIVQFHLNNFKKVRDT